MVLPSNSVFISYRKDDSAGWSATLANELRSVLGGAAVFIDDSTGIPFGTQWPDQISVALNQCRVFLPVIAPSWHQTTNLNRLKEPDDWVRQELITTHSRGGSVLCIPVFVNEASTLDPEQYSDDPELQTVIADLMADQGIRLDRGTEYWPTKIDGLISKIETHLGIDIPRPDRGLMPDDTNQLSRARSPVIQWLSAHATWLGAAGSIAGVIALYPIFFGSSEPVVTNTVHVEDTSGDVQVAGRDITNIGDPNDKKTIASLRQITQSQQETIDRLIRRLPDDKLSTNEQVREGIADAVIGLSDTDSEPSLIKQAEDALAQGHTELAQTLYKADGEKKVAAGQAQLQEAAQSYRRLGALAFLDDTTEALEAYQKAAEAWPDDIRAWNQLGQLYQRTGQLEQAMEAYGTVGELADLTGEPQAWKATSFGYLGIVHEIRGELNQAVEMHEKSLVLNTELGRKEGMALNYNSLGNVYKTHGELDQAKAMYEKALIIETELGGKKGMAINYSSLGNVHWERGELDQAAAMYEKALALSTELGRKVSMAVNYGNLGLVHWERGELEQAVAMYEKALALSTELGHKEGMANQYNSLGNLHKKRGELEQAVAMYEKALVLNTELGRKVSMAVNYGNLGMVHKTRGELDQAVALYEKALVLNTELGRKKGMAIQYRNLGKVYEIRGQLNKARKSWEQSADLYDAISTSNAAKVRSWIDELDID